MSPRFRLSLRGLALALLIPCLLASAVLLGWITYRDLYGIILGGFDRKLEAVSTGTAAFIDGDVHQRIRTVRRLVGLAGDPSRPFLWGLDEVDGRLVSVDVGTGGARPWADMAVDGAVGLVWDDAEGRLLTVRTATGEVLVIDPVSEGIEVLGGIAIGSRALALDGRRRRLIAAGPWGLHGYDLDGLGLESEPTWIDEGQDLQAITVDPETNRLYAIDRDGSLLVADSVGAAFGKPTVLEEAQEEALTEEQGALPLVRALSTTTLEPGIFAAADRLIRIMPEQGTFATDPYRSGYRDPGSSMYLGYFQPMGRIMAVRGITYLYTQQLVGTTGIEYVIDATQGENHSPIGTTEELESREEIEGLAAVVGAGIVYTSAIEYSDEWGLLKSASAPIYRSDGSIDGMVGADVSVSTIQDQTRVALASVGLVTLAILFLGSLSTLWISRRLTTPIRAVQTRATHVAAGHFETVIEPPGLRELAVLTDAFNEMTETLQSSVNELENETKKVKEMRTRRHLLRALATRHDMASPLPEGVDGGHAHRRVVRGRSEAVAATLGDKDVVIVRLSGDLGDPVQSLASRAEFTWLAPRVASTLATSVEDILEILGDTARELPAALAVVDVDAGRITLDSPEDLPARLIAADRSEAPIVLPARGSYDVPPGAVLVLSERNAPGYSARGEDTREFQLSISGPRS